MPAIVDDVAAIHRALNREGDGLAALLDARFLTEVMAEPSTEDDDLDVAAVDQASAEIAWLDDQIAGIVATSAAGIIAQVRVFRELGWGTYCAGDVYHSDGCADRLFRSIVAGIERLSGASAR